jgi:hypothetical protein
LSLIKDGTRDKFNFTSIESCALFLEGLRALHIYEDETGKYSPSREKLERSLEKARDKLSDCVIVYPDDRIPHFYYAIVLTLQNQVIYATRVRERLPALLALGQSLAFRQALHRLEPNLNLEAEAESWPVPDESSAWLRLRYQQEIADAAPFSNLILGKWPLLTEASDEFAGVVRRGPEELKNTAAYNLALVHSRRGDERSLRQGLEVLSQIKLSPPLSNDAQALQLQIDVLAHSLRARVLIETGGTQDEFDLYWNALQEMDVAIESSGLFSAYVVDLRADYLIKSGYVLYDQAFHDRFTDSAPGALDAAAERFSDALSVRKSWNQAQLYLAITSAVQSGVALAQVELAGEFDLDLPNADFEELLDRSKALFDSLQGKVVTTEKASKPALSESEAFLKAARDLFRAIQQNGAEDAGEDAAEKGGEEEYGTSEKTDGEET